MSQEYYDSRKVVAQNLFSHFGELEPPIPESIRTAAQVPFPTRCVRVLNKSTIPEGARALDLGCACGGSTFELSLFCTEVLGIDLSVPLIQAANALLSGQSVHYSLQTEGELMTHKKATLPEGTSPESVHFEVRDALEAVKTLPPFHIVAALNLLCRVESPEELLRGFSRIVIPGGQLILATPFSWKESFTKKDKWLGGVIREGKEIRGKDTLLKLLEADFQLEACSEEPYILSHHERFYELGVSHLTHWTRKQ